MLVLILLIGGLTRALADDVRFTDEEQSAVLDALFGTNNPGDIHLDSVVRWEEGSPIYRILADDSGVAEKYLKEFVSEIQTYEIIDASISHGQANVILVVSEDIVATARNFRDALAMFFPGSERVQLALADDFIDQNSNENAFMQIALRTAEEGISGAMIFVHSGDGETATAQRIATMSMRALGFVGDTGVDVQSVLALEHPADRLTDFDLRLIRLVYGGDVRSGDSFEQVVEALRKGDL